MDHRKEHLLQLDEKLKQTILASADLSDDAINDFFLHEAHEGHESCFDVEGILEECTDNVVPWIVYNWLPNGIDQPLAKTYLQEHKSELSQEEQAFIAAALNVPFRFYQITSLNVDSLELTDVLSGVKLTAFAPEIDEAYEQDDIITARIVTTSEGPYLASVMDVILPIDAAEDIQAIHSDASWVDEHCDDIVRQVYFDLSAHYLEEGDEDGSDADEWESEDETDIQFVTLTYQLNCTTQEAFELLHPLCSEDAREVLLENAAKSDTGELKQITFPWLDEDSALDDQDIEESMLGMITLEGSQLVVEVNSALLATIIKSHIEEVCGQSAKLESESIESLEDVIAAMPEAERKIFDEA